ncbi:MAG: hypothetical protein EOP05_17375 [Proteobacteria bacterium]|nr:MAG: hypothetical protein EOP05_17375 [Pseudomonadota bacterium]
MSWRAAAKEAAMPVLQFAASPRNESAYPDQLAAFQAAAEKLAAQANDIDSAMEQKREIASSNLDGVVSSLTHLRDETAALTGRPQASNQ